MKVTNQPALLTRYFLFIAAVSISFGCYAQQSPDDERETVMYDPLFWKDELSLRQTQSRKIEEINTEFYENLRQVKDEQANQAEMHEQLERGLHERSQKIYETLLPKQRRKLEKIVDKTAPAITAQ
jgi:hypothetical protein